MTGKFIAIAPERIAEGKRLYELTRTPVPDIAAMMGISRKTLDRRVLQWGWTPRSTPRLEAYRALLAAPPAKPAPPAAVQDDTLSEAELCSANNLHTCPQQAWVSFHRTVRSFLDLPDDLMIYSGMALGYEDPDAAINGWRSPRAALGDFASFDGFDS